MFNPQQIQQMNKGKNGGSLDELKPFSKSINVSMYQGEISIKSEVDNPFTLINKLVTNWGLLERAL
jgi:calcineurin-like phosphoesterase